MSMTLDIRVPDNDPNNIIKKTLGLQIILNILLWFKIIKIEIFKEIF